MNVHIRRKKSPKSDKITISLEIYKGYTKNDDGKIKANRETQKLDYFLYANPNTPTKTSHNKEVEKKIEAINRNQILHIYRECEKLVWEI